MKVRLLALLVLMANVLSAQNVNNIQMPELMQAKARKSIQVPNILGYQTLKCDFHMHTVFSDGSVWPTIRVDEAWKNGLDAIAITDHIERHPGKKHVGGDDNSSYEIALPYARQKNILLVKAGEITRSMPPGHFNALFLKDTNELDKQDWNEAFEAAKNQGAYIIWNHPGWRAQQPDTTKWWPIHTELYEKGMLHAIEVFNEKEWYPIAMDWCMEKNLAVTAATDVHGIISEQYDLDKYHRPMTLVLAKERTLASLREALFANRTIAWFGNNLAGKEEYLKAFYNAAVEVKFYDKTKSGKIYIFSNNSDVPFSIQTIRGPEFTIPSMGEVMVTLKENQTSFSVKNLFTSGAGNLVVKLK